jgi:hypothetical protein
MMPTPPANPSASLSISHNLHLPLSAAFAQSGMHRLVMSSRYIGQLPYPSRQTPDTASVVFYQRFICL